MKKLLLTLTAVAGLTMASKAQTEQGKFIVGGQVGFHSEKVEDSEAKNTGFSINPTVGYFVSDNWAVGTAIGYNWSEQKSGSTVDIVTKNNAFNLAPFVRNYIGEGSFKFFSQLSVPMQWGETEYKDGTDDYTNKFASYGVELAPGVAFFPTPKVGVELKVRGLYYNHYDGKDSQPNSNSFGLDANSLSPTLGVQFHF
ncbi:porin family protein [Sphingobacterium shayense]|uniref:outer membrane beta-barrel protein n=1 Tax=Sphingobacterium shayense TaxID=626343 RepID=UPI0015581849|nr:outer membrane beta-barrel protein [Sphingobacterium shayense]NQD70092.1 porin family protein [Sphingobacterium shayense]